MIIASGFPNPVSWSIDKVSGFVADTASSGFEMIIGGLVAWVVDAVVWVVGGVFNFFLDSTDPNVQADWFITGTGPYATTASIGATLLVLFALAGVAQGAVNGDVGGMLRRIALDLPISVIGMVGLVTITQALIRLTDVLSMHVMGNFQDDIAEFGTVVASLQFLTGGGSSAFVVFILGLVTALAGLVLVAELVIRAALIYIVVALAPLVFATRLWPATKGASRKLLDLLVALILSKLVIAIALAVGAAAAVGVGSGGEVTALPAPEVFAEDPGGSVTQAVGLLLTAAAAFGVAAFSPMVVAKLLPITEAAIVSQGVRGGPVRAGHQGLMMANTMQMVSGRRLNQLASGKGGPGSQVSAGAGSKPPGAGLKGAGATGTGAAGAGGSGAAGGAAAGGTAAAAGPVGAAAAGVSATTSAVKGAASKAGDSASKQADQPSQSSGSDQTKGAPPKSKPPSSSPKTRQPPNADNPSGPKGSSNDK